MVIQVVISIFVVFAISRVAVQYRKKKMTTREFLFWTVFWLAIAVFVVYPEIANRVADILGVGRGVDVAIYLAVLLIFYLLFRLFVRMEKIEQDITTIVRDRALRDGEKK